MSEVKWVNELSSDCQFIDVREPSEFNSEKISGALLLPLSQLSEKVDTLDKSRPLVLVCRTGNRASHAARELIKQGFTDVRILEGGIEAWKAAGKATVKATGGVWGMERQVRFTAGLFVLVGALGVLLVHPGFLALCLFVGGGLIFSGISDTCAMAVILSKMPWNRPA